MRDSVDDHVEAWLKELPGLDPLKEQIIARLSIAARHVSAVRSNALDADGLPLWQFKTLLMLRRQGQPYELSPSRLADMLGLTRGALSARLTALEQRGMVVRDHDGDDRRRVRVRLTPSGRRILESQIDTEDRREHRLLSVLSDQEKHTLSNLLRKLVLAVES